MDDTLNSCAPLNSRPGRSAGPRLERDDRRLARVWAQQQPDAAALCARLDALQRRREKRRDHGQQPGSTHT